jgi:hypothetical protein
MGCFGRRSRNKQIQCYTQFAFSGILQGVTVLWVLSRFVAVRRGDGVDLGRPTAADAGLLRAHLPKRAGPRRLAEQVSQSLLTGLEQGYVW